MPHTVLVSDPVEIEDLNLGDSFQVDYMPKITREELLERIGDYEAIVVRSRTKVDAELIARAKKLRMVARPGTGLDNVDLAAASARGIEVVNSPEALSEGVAEHVIAMMLSLSRSLAEADASMKSGKWEKERFYGVELKGKTIGIVGLGRIGRRVGEIAKVIGMDVLGYDVVEIDRAALDAMGCKMADLDTIFSNSDYITLHVPLAPETRHMVDTRRLSLMKKSAYLFNASRGAVIDEEALAVALKDGVISGAGLDVFENEPPKSSILSAPNVLLTPHIAGQTVEAQKMAIQVVASKLIKHFK